MTMHGGLGDEERLGQILDELVRQSRNGETPEVEARCAEYPELAEQIRELFAALSFLEENKPVVSSGEANAPAIVQEKNATIGGYLIVREIARGGMGIVYEAIQLSLQRRVALKVISRHLLQDKKSIERFRREARLASQLHHSNIVPVFDVGEQGDVGYYAMQFISGQSLDQVIREMALLAAENLPRDSFQATGIGRQEASSAVMTAEEYSSERPYRSDEPDPSAKSNPSDKPNNKNHSSAANFSSPGNSRHPLLYRNAARIALQIAEALAYAHERGILHRDIKPSNILIDAEGNAWVTDFGLARFDDSTGHGDESLTKTGDIVGTLKYLAPERLRGKHDHRCDIYGLAATVYELVLCRPLFQAIDRVHLVDLVSNAEPERPGLLDRRMPRDLETIILKGLNKQPEKRYQSAQSMADDLRLFLLDRPIQARRVTSLQKAAMWSRRNRVAAGLASVLSIAMVILLATFLVNRTLTSQRDEATKARNTAIELLDRTAKAEQESVIRAQVNEIAAYRMTLEPELTPMLDRLKKVSLAKQSDELRSLVRNEVTSCLLRDDWYKTTRPLSRPAVHADYDARRNRVASLTSDGELELTDFHSEELLAKTKTSVPFQWVRFSPEGDYLILWASNNSFAVIHASDLTEVETSKRMAMGCLVADPGQRMLFWHEGLITVERMEPGTEPRVILHHGVSAPLQCLDLSRDGRLLAYQDSTQIVVVDVDSGKILSQKKIETGIAMALSPDGRWLAYSDGHGQLHVRNARTLELQTKPTSYDNVISRICWDRDSRLLAITTWGRMTAVVNPWTQQMLIRTRQPMDGFRFVFEEGHFGNQFHEGKLDVLHWRKGLAQDISAGPMRAAEALQQVEVHPSLPLMVGRTTDRLLWFEFPSGRLLFECRGFRPRACRFNEDGSEFLMLDKSVIQRWKIASDSSTSKIVVSSGAMLKHQLAESGGSISLASYIQPDFQRAVTIASAGSVVVELNLNSGLVTRTYCSSPGFDLLQIADGQLCGLHNWLENSITLLDTHSGKVLGQLDTGPYSRIYADPKSKTLATTNERQVEFWTSEPLARTGKTLPHPVQHGQVVWHPRGQHLVTQTESSTLVIRTVESLESVVRLQADPGAVLTRLHFNRNGEYLLGVAAASNMRIWHLGKLQSKLRDWELDWETDLNAERQLKNAPEWNEKLESRASVGSEKIGEVAGNSNKMLASREKPIWNFDFSSAQPSTDLLLAMSIDEDRVLYERDKSDFATNNLAWSLLLANRSPEDAAEAESLMQPLVARLPNNSHYQNTYGLALYRVGRLKEARDVLQKNYQNTIGSPNSAFDTMVLALAYKKMGDDFQAASHLALTDHIRLDSIEMSTTWKDQLHGLRAEFSD